MMTISFIYINIHLVYLRRYSNKYKKKRQAKALQYPEERERERERDAPPQGINAAAVVVVA